MAKYYGIIGFGQMTETAPDVYAYDIKERKYYGDLIKNYKKVQTNSEKLNDDISISNQISIIADPYAFRNFNAMLYATFSGIKWKILDVEIQHPRLILTLGGMYNEQSD